MAWPHMVRVRELGLPPVQKLLLFALASRADDAGICWPSIWRLGRDTGLSRRAVQIHLARLIESGALARELRIGRSNSFRLQLDIPDVVDGHSVGARQRRAGPTCGQLEPDLRTSCAPTAHAVRTPAHVLRLSRASRAPEVTSEVQPKSNKQSFVREAAGDKPSLRRDSAWWRDRKSVMQMGAELGVDARPGEGYADYKDRVYGIWREWRDATRSGRNAVTQPDI